MAPGAESAIRENSRPRKLQRLGVLSGFAAGAWLGAAEAPTKLVSVGISPIVISLIMVIGVFLARWSLPALILGTSSIRADLRRTPHLIVWAILAGCLWAVANTMTIFAIRDIGLSIAFPLWNSNSLLGILWGVIFFKELRDAGWRRWTGVARRRAGHVCRRHFARRSIFDPGARRAFAARSLGRTGRRNSLGNDVYSLPQSLLVRDESTFFCDILHLR